MENPQAQSPDSAVRHKWFSSPVIFHEGSLSDVRAHIPDFERRSFGLAQPGGECTCVNTRLDTIVRRPFQDDGNYIPVGVVSKDYTLVPHTAVLDIAERTLRTAKVEPADVKAEIEITEHGERIHLSLYLPKQFDFDPGDGHQMALRLECFNSVDGSTRFRSLMGWFRFVCSNGMIVGIARSDLYRRHVGKSPLEEVGGVLARGLAESEKEKNKFEQWRKAEITADKFVRWINNDLKEEWGFKAAARAYHIARFGSDAKVVGPYNGNVPNTVQMEALDRIPGTPERCRTIFDLSQILAWLAKERRDVQEQLDWRENIPALLAPLMN